MSNYDPATGAPTATPAPPAGQPYPYAYNAHPAMLRPRRRWPIETKPFFLTSEFAVALISVIALGITAAASESIDARFFWAVTGAIVIGYMVSRGIAKSGTRSHSADPREHLDLLGGDGTREQHAGSSR
jgi:hypothetical protein